MDIKQKTIYILPKEQAAYVKINEFWYAISVKEAKTELAAIKACRASIDAVEKYGDDFEKLSWSEMTKGIDLNRQDPVIHLTEEQEVEFNNLKKPNDTTRSTGHTEVR